MLYFLAGLKKSNMEWLEGYAMTNIGKHWVFEPFRYASFNSSDMIKTVDAQGVWKTKHFG